MRVLREWLHRLVSTVRPARRDEDLEEELRLHLELVADAARRRGENPDEAVRLARIEAGAPAQAMDALRDQRGVAWLEDLARDAAYGIRALRRRPGFAATAILSLALGIGANAGIFSLVDQLLLRRLPVPDADRLVLFDWRGSFVPSVQFGESSLISYPLCQDLAAQERFFDGVLCRHPGVVNVAFGSEYERVPAEVVSGSYFPVLGVRPALGRLIGPADDRQPASHPVVVLSHDYWQNNLGGASDIVGRRVLVNNFAMTVIGVAAPGFRGMDVGAPAALWVPTMMAREALLEFSRIADRRAFWLNGFARLKPGVSAEDARAGLQPWFKAMLEEDTRREGFPPVSDEQRRLFLAASLDIVPAPLGWSSLRQLMARPLWTLLGGTTLLLLLACLNVASLLLARGAERGPELSTRMALGASRSRVVRQLIVESLILALAGAAVGALVAPLVTRLMLVFLPEGTSLTPAIDLRLLSFAFGSAVVAGVLVGLAPALQAGRRPLTAVISGRSPAAGAPVRLRKLIVGAQLAVTLVLLAGAGLFGQTLLRLYTRDRGFDSAQLIMFRADATGTGSSAAEDAPLVLSRVMTAVREVPSVERVAVANNGLLGSLGPGRVLTIDAGERIVLEQPLPMMRIGAGFFAALGTRILAGREFDERDVVAMRDGRVRSILVNESFARRFFDGRSPVGRRVGFGNLPDTPLDAEIIGVVGDFRRRYLRDDVQPEHIFIPFADTGIDAGDGTIFVRVRGEPAAFFAPIRAAVATVDPRLPLANLTTLDDQVERHLLRETMLATLSTAFGAVALVLAAVGLFGVMSFVVTQRTQEIGMRMALGATRAGAIWLVVRDALVTIGGGAAAGVFIGVTTGVLAADWLAGVLYNISPGDVATFAVTTAGLTAVALSACIVPAGRAAVMSPMVAIRDQSESMWQVAGQRVRRAMRDLAASGEGDAGAATLVTDVSGEIHRATSFAEAVTTALETLRVRVGASSVLLLEKDGGGRYRGGTCSVPADGILINRMRRYPHPLPLTPADVETWRRWAREVRPSHVAELEQLAATDARMVVPLRTSHELVGILLLGPPVNRNAYSAPDRELLASAADIFALLIENGRLSARALEQERLRRDLALAAEVQRRLLPPSPPQVDGVRLAAFTLPARSVGGDYYDFFELGPGRVGLAIADVAGKGVPAALLMSAVQASLRVLADRQLSASQVAAQMNRLLYQSTAMSSYATFFFAHADSAARRVFYVNAGHNPPYLVRRTATGVDIQELTVGGTVIGLFPDMAYEEGDVDLRPGDLLLAYTDGVPEARSATGEEFGEDRLKAFVHEACSDPPDAIAARLSATLRDWMAGAEQHDDVTFVVAAFDA